jgi:hypothetical protein
MTRREWYAGMAMQGMIGSGVLEVNPPPGSTNEEAIAKAAFALADALLAEMEK